MEMVTVKRNGVYISFPELTVRNGSKRDDVIAGSRIMAPAKKKVQKEALSVNRPIQSRRIKPVYSQMKARSIVKPAKVGRRCIHCGEECWRSDVSYCWECYKYEFFESK